MNAIDANTIDVIHKVNSTKYDDFNLLYWNINSIGNKLFSLEDAIRQNYNRLIHFVALTETKLFEHENTFYNLPGFVAYHNTIVLMDMVVLLWT